MPFFPSAAPPDDSPIQRLPPEILLRVFTFVAAVFSSTVEEDLIAWPLTSTCPCLRHCALVCRAWKGPAQNTLFHSIRFRGKAQCDQFVEVVRERPALGAKVRALCVGLRGDPEAEKLKQEEKERLSSSMMEALSLCININILAVRLLTEASRPHFLSLVQTLPIRNLLLKSYDTAIPITRHECYRFCTIPSLRTFEMNFRPRWKGPDTPRGPPVDEALSSRVESGSLTVNVPRETSHIVAFFAKGPLKRLTVYTEDALDPVAAEAGFGILAACPTLEEFRFESNIEPSDGGAAANNAWFLRLLSNPVEYIQRFAPPAELLATFGDLAANVPLPEGLTDITLAADEEAVTSTVDSDLVHVTTEAFARRGVRFEVRTELGEVPRKRWVDPCATLYALSKNTPQDLVPSFRRALAPPGSVAVAGTLSELLPPSLISRLAPSLPPSEAFSISLARYSPSGGERVVPWRSSLTGRPNIALGREIKPELHALSEGEEGAFEAFLRGEKWSFGAVSVGATEPPKDAIEGIEREDPKDVSQILCFTADRLQPFLSVLSSYPSAAVAGLVGSSTPFHSPSHDPYSLFLDEKETFSSGAVGLAVVRDGSAQTDGKVEARLNYGGLKKLGSEMEVTSSRGNIVLTLSSQNAARTLLNEVNNLFGTAAANLSALQRSEEKEKEFYAAIFSEKPVSPLDLSKARLVAKINAGDPSRGAMSVETEEEVRQGDWLVVRSSLSSSSPYLTFHLRVSHVHRV
ncbi:hypothetical protein JCM10213v2_008738 [Rhodosporidiobolus nylandii]